MKVITTKDAKNSLDELIDLAQHEPVLITKRNHLVGIFMSVEEAERTPKLKDKLLKHMNKTVQSPLLSMLGAHKDNRVFKSANDADKFIKLLRDEWA